MLSDLPTFKSFLRLDAGDLSEDTYDAQLLQAADRIFKSWAKGRDFETLNYTRNYSGQDELELALRQRPVQAPVFSGSLTNGLATFTGMSCLTGYATATSGTVLSGTQNLIVGMPAAVVASSGATAKLATLPINTKILSVDSPTQVTLTNAATVGGTFNLVFGLDVYLDLQGWYGDAPGAFGAPTQLMLGTNYVLKRDQPDGSSKSGLLQRLTGGPIGAGWWGFGDNVRFGGGVLASITAAPLPRWISGIGNVKVAWTAGIGFGATPPTGTTSTGGTLPALTTIPFELTDAVNKLAAWLRLTTPRGAPLDTLSFSPEQARQQIGGGPKVGGGQGAGDADLGTVIDVARRWREMSV